MSDTSPRILVLSGGISHERDVSLRSGGRVADALQAAGATVLEREPDAGLVAALRQERPDVIWPALHGSSGEDGALRGLLDLLGIPYVGSSAGASRLAWDKSVAKELVSRAGVSTPPSVTVSRETIKELDAGAVMALVGAHAELPLVVKPNKGGSSQGITFVSDPGQLPAAMIEAFTYRSSVLIERQVVGTEVTVTILDLGDGPVALDPVEIAPLGGVYSFEARYTAGETEFFAPARIPDAAKDAAKDAALRAHSALGLSGLCRMDLILENDGTPWFLEANVAPGLTETSSVPIALVSAGYDLGEVYLKLAELATA